RRRASTNCSEAEMLVPGLRSFLQACVWQRLAALALALGSVAGSAQAVETLRVLAWPGYADADIVKVFEKRMHVAVQVTVVSSDENLWDRVSANHGADFDVFAVNTAELKRYVDQGLSVPLDLANIPNAAGPLPRFRDRNPIPNLVRASKPYALPYTDSEMGIISGRPQATRPP